VRPPSKTANSQRGDAAIPPFPVGLLSPFSSFCSLFELPDRVLPHLVSATEIVAVDDRAEILQTASGDRRDLRRRALSKRESSDRGAPQIMKREAVDLRLLASLGEGRPKNVRDPRSAELATERRQPFSAPSLSPRCGDRARSCFARGSADGPRVSTALGYSAVRHPANTSSSRAKPPATASTMSVACSASSSLSFSTVSAASPSGASAS
jgi:hypothetical protein